MLMHSRAALMAGATLLGPLARAPEIKESAGLTGEIKSAVDALTTTFEAFKTKNDQQLAELGKKREDVLTKEEVERIQDALDTQIKAVKKAQEDFEAKANRLQLFTGPQGAEEAKAAAAFADLIGKQGYSPEELKAYRADLGNYLRRSEAKATTMQVAIDPAGGYWVTPDVSGRMVQKIYETTPMRQLANVVQIGTDRLEGPIDNGEFDAAWVGEAAPRNQTDTSGTGMWSIDVNELYAYPKVTQKLLEDARIDVEAWISNKATSKFARKENAAFVNGTGVQQPKGFLTYTTSAADDSTRPWGTFQYVPTGAAGAFANAAPADCYLTLIFELKAAYRQDASFLMARRTMRETRKLKDGQGNYLVDLRLRDSALVETIFGFPVVDGEDMPAIAANSLSVAFGDFEEAYTIVDRLGTSVVRDNITQPGFVKFNMRRRVGGGAVNFEALKLLKFAAN